MKPDQAREWEELRRTWSRAGYVAVTILLMGVLAPVLTVALVEFWSAHVRGIRHNGVDLAIKAVGFSLAMSAVWSRLSLRSWDRQERAYQEFIETQAGLGDRS